MRRYVALTLVVAGLLAGGTARAEEQDRAAPTAYLYVSGKGGATGEIVRGGVPFSPSMNVTDLSKYALWRPTSADGKTGVWVPVQWSALSRFGGTATDETRPVRWALAQFPGFEGPYQLRLRGTETFTAPADVAVQSTTAIDVDTGPLRFRVPRDGKFGPLGDLTLVTQGADGKVLESKPLADGPGMDVVMTLCDRDPVSGNVVDTTYKLSETAISDVAVEENGPWRSVIRIRGKFQDKEGRPLLGNHLGYTIRLWADRGSDQVRVFFTLENNGVYGPPADSSRQNPKPQWIRIRHLDLVLPTRLAGEKLRGATSDGVWDFKPGAEGADFRLLQQHSVVNEKNENENFRYSVRAAQGWRTVQDTPAGMQPVALGPDVAKGTRSDGGIRVDDGTTAISAAVRHFWQSYPKAMSFDDGALKIELWPKEPGEKWPADLPKRWGDAYEFEGGRHKTYEVAIGFSRPGTAAHAQNVLARTDHFQNPPAVTIDPAYVQSTRSTLGAFAIPSMPGPSLSMVEAQEHHARMQLGQVDVAFCDPQGSGGEIPPASLVTQRETRGHALPSAVYNLDLYGYTNFGDLPHDLGYCYGHHDWVRGLFINWLRFGKREFLDIGTEMLRYRYDYGQYHCQDQQDPVWKWYNGFQRFEVGFHGARLKDFEPGGEATGVPQNTWLEGLLIAHAVTGDPRALETARENADAFVNYFTVSGATDPTLVRGALDYFGQLSAMSVGVHQLLAFYEYTGEQRYFDTAMLVFDNGLVKAEEYYGQGGFFNPTFSQMQVWPVVRMIQPLISVHRLARGAQRDQALGMLIRILTWLNEKAYDGGEVDDQGLYLPYQLPYQWELEDNKPVPRRWFIPYNFFAADGYAYAYLAMRDEPDAKQFLDLARGIYRDGVIFFQAPVHQAVPPGFYSHVSYSPRQYPNSETKNNAWQLNHGQWYLHLEQILAAQGAEQTPDPVKFADWFAVRRRENPTYYTKRPVGWFGWMPVSSTGGYTPVRIIAGEPTPVAPVPIVVPATPAKAAAPSTPATQAGAAPSSGTAPKSDDVLDVPPPPRRNPTEQAPPVPTGTSSPGTGNAGPVLPPKPDAPQPKQTGPQATVVIMDDRDAVLSGNWSTVQSDTAHNKAYREAAAGVQNATATFTVPVLVESEYRLYIWWPKADGASSRTFVEVGTSQGWDQYFPDQSKESGRWRMIGVVRNAGPKNPVTIRFSSAKATGRVLVDAVKLEPVSVQR